MECQILFRFIVLNVFICCNGLIRGVSFWWKHLCNVNETEEHEMWFPCF